MSTAPHQPDSPAPDDRSRREVELRKLIPNLMTCGAFCCGVASIYHCTRLATPAEPESIHRKLSLAIALLGAAFLLDAFDGRMARLLKVSSRFGEKFDSISDFVCFGLAPAFILYRWRLFELGDIGFGVGVVYALCAAIRLARFTVQARRKKLGAPVSKFFQGLPAPAAAFVVLIPVMLALSHIVTNWLRPDWASDAVTWVVIGFTLLVAGLMVSTIPMASVKHVKVNRKLMVPLLIGVGVIAIAMIKDTWLTLSVLALLYLLSLPFSVARARRQPV